MFYWASFTDSLEGWERNIYIGSVATYLLGASLWSILVYNIVKQKLDPAIQSPGLIITALGTLGVLVSVAYTEKDRSSVTYILALIAASIFCFQHCFFDLIYWSKIHTDRRKVTYR